MAIKKVIAPVNDANFVEITAYPALNPILS